MAHRNLARVKPIIQFLHTYPASLKAMELEDLIQPEKIVQYHNDWCRLVDQYNGVEKEAYVPTSLLLNRNSFHFFMDLEDDRFPVYEISYIFSEPDRCLRINVFDDIRDLMLHIEDEPYIRDLFERHKEDRLQKQLQLMEELSSKKIASQ